MKAIYKMPGQDPEIIDIDNSLEALQSAVYGSIEVFPLGRDADIICNEEGKLWGMPYNITLQGEPFVGPILIVGTGGEEFRDLENAEYLRDCIAERAVLEQLIRRAAP